MRCANFLPKMINILRLSTRILCYHSEMLRYVDHTCTWISWLVLFESC